MPSRPELYTPTGLNWDLIREEFITNASPEEREAQEASLVRPMSERVKKPVVPQARRAYPNRLSDEKIELMCDYYRAGNKVPWISKETGVSEATVRKHLNDAGIYDRNRDRGRQ